MTAAQFVFAGLTLMLVAGCVVREEGETEATIATAARLTMTATATTRATAASKRETIFSADVLPADPRGGDASRMVPGRGEC